MGGAFVISNVAVKSPPAAASPLGRSSTVPPSGNSPSNWTRPMLNNPSRRGQSIDVGRQAAARQIADEQLGRRAVSLIEDVQNGPIDVVVVAFTFIEKQTVSAAADHLPVARRFHRAWEHVPIEPHLNYAGAARLGRTGGRVRQDDHRRVAGTIARPARLDGTAVRAHVDSLTVGIGLRFPVPVRLVGRIGRVGIGLAPGRCRASRLHR